MSHELRYLEKLPWVNQPRGTRRLGLASPCAVLWIRDHSLAVLLQGFARLLHNFRSRPVLQCPAC